MKIFLALAIMFSVTAFSTVALGQVVYRCTDAKGVRIFSTEPCAKDAKATNFKPPSAEVAADRADASCRRAATDLLVKTDDSGIDAAKAEMDSLSKSSHQGTPAENEAWKQNAQSRMDALQAYINQQELHNATVAGESKRKQDEALAKCDKQKAERETKASTEPL
jgi:hypothetical protein